MFARILDAVARTPVDTFVPPSKYHQAATYAAHLRDLSYELEDDGSLSVQTRLPNAIDVVTVEFYPKRDAYGRFSFDFSSTCTACPESSRLCVHAGALSLSMRVLATHPTAKDISAVLGDQREQRLSDGISQWLGGLAHDAPRAAPGEGRRARRGASIPADAHLQFVLSITNEQRLELTSVYMDDSETLRNLRRFDLGTIASTTERVIEARLTPEERGLLMQLRGCRPSNTKATVNISTALDQKLLGQLIDAHLVLQASAGEQNLPLRVRWGEPRVLAPQWEVTNALTCRLDVGLTLGTNEILLAAPTAWILDRPTATIFPVGGLTLEQVQLLQRAPEIPRAQIKRFNEALSELSLPIPIPPPEEIPDPVETVIAPRALVVLSSATRLTDANHWSRSGSARYGGVPIVGDLFFRYGTGRVSAEDVATRSIIARRPEGFVSYVRDPDAEMALAKIVHTAGLRRETSYYGADPRRQKWVDQSRLGQEAITLMQALTAKGVQVELAPSLGVRFIEDAAENTYGEVEEGAGGRYTIDAGVIVDGQRISLVDLAQAAMVDPTFSIAPDPEHDAERRLLVPCGQTKVVSLPHARVREIIGPFFEFLVAHKNHVPGVSRDRQGRLLISRAALLSEVFAHRATGASFLDWSGMRAIQDAAQRLREHGIEEVPPTPPGFVGELRDYQQTGVKWLNVLAELGLGGVLADDMGLGKSVQLLAHIAIRRNKKQEPPVLIVAPAPVIGSWRDKFYFTPDLKMLVLTGPDRASRFDQIPVSDVVFTNYNTLRLDIETLVQHRYSLVVFDEAQNLKSVNTVSHAVAERLNAEQVIMVSGRPVENHLGELFAQTRLALPGLLGEQRDFTRFYRTPIEKRGDAEARDRLRRRIAPFILRRTKDQVAKSLPPKTTVMRTVTMTPGQQKLYNAIMLAMNRRVWGAVDQKGIASASIVILDSIRKMQQICCHPRMVKDDVGRSCDESAKFDFLMQQVEELVEEGRRLLVFSQYVEFLELLGEGLDARGITYLMFTGKTRDKDATRAQFQSGVVPVMLVSLKAGGAGMDFTAADTVLMASPWWNPGAEDQAIDRAHRIGQTKPVFVYKYIVENSIEAIILQMQEKKSALARSILDDDSGAAPPIFEIDDVINLFGDRDFAMPDGPDVIDGEWSEVSPTARALPPPPKPTSSASSAATASQREGSRRLVIRWVTDQLAIADMTAAEMNRRLRLTSKWISNRISGTALFPPSTVVLIGNELGARVPDDIINAAIEVWGSPDPDLERLLKRSPPATN